MAAPSGAFASTASIGLIGGELLTSAIAARIFWAASMNWTKLMAGNSELKKGRRRLAGRVGPPEGTTLRSFALLLLGHGRGSARSRRGGSRRLATRRRDLRHIRDSRAGALSSTWRGTPIVS